MIEKSSNTPQVLKKDWLSSLRLISYNNLKIAIELVKIGYQDEQIELFLNVIFNLIKIRKINSIFGSFKLWFCF